MYLDFELFSWHWENICSCSSNQFGCVVSVILIQNMICFFVNRIRLGTFIIKYKSILCGVFFKKQFGMAKFVNRFTEQSSNGSVKRWSKFCKNLDQLTCNIFWIGFSTWVEEGLKICGYLNLYNNFWTYFTSLAPPMPQVPPTLLYTKKPNYIFSVILETPQLNWYLLLVTIGVRWA